jgi:hypothetical protein
LINNLDGAAIFRKPPCTGLDPDQRLPAVVTTS